MSLSLSRYNIDSLVLHFFSFPFYQYKYRRITHTPHSFCMPSGSGTVITFSPTQPAFPISNLPVASTVYQVSGNAPQSGADMPLYEYSTVLPTGLFWSLRLGLHSGVLLTMDAALKIGGVVGLRFISCASGWGGGFLALIDVRGLPALLSAPPHGIVSAVVDADRVFSLSYGTKCCPGITCVITAGIILELWYHDQSLGSQFTITLAQLLYPPICTSNPC